MKNVFLKPSKTTLIICLAILLAGFTCSLLAMSNFFTVSPFQGKNLVFIGVNVAAIVSALVLYANYQRTKKVQAEDTK